MALPVQKAGQDATSLLPNPCSEAGTHASFEYMAGHSNAHLLQMRRTHTSCIRPWWQIIASTLSLPTTPFTHRFGKQVDLYMDDMFARHQLALDDQGLRGVVVNITPPAQLGILPFSAHMPEAVHRWSGRSKATRS